MLGKHAAVYRVWSLDSPHFCNPFYASSAHTAENCPNYVEMPTLTKQQLKIASWLERKHAIKLFRSVALRLLQPCLVSSGVFTVSHVCPDCLAFGFGCTVRTFPPPPHLWGEQHSAQFTGDATSARKLEWDYSFDHLKLPLRLWYVHRERDRLR